MYIPRLSPVFSSIAVFSARPQPSNPAPYDPSTTPTGSFEPRPAGCDAPRTTLRPPTFSSIQQYSAVFSSIQQYSAVFARLDFGDPVQQCCRKRVRRGTMGPEVASERQIDGSSSDGSMEEGPMLRLTASVCVLSAKWDRGGGCDGGCQVESMLLAVPVGATRARQTSA